MMATASHRPQHIHNGVGGYHRRGGRAPQYLIELSQCLLDFVVQLLPTKEEVSVKEDVRFVLFQGILWFLCKSAHPRQKTAGAADQNDRADGPAAQFWLNR